MLLARILIAIIIGIGGLALIGYLLYLLRASILQRGGSPRESDFRRVHLREPRLVKLL